MPRARNALRRLGEIIAALAFAGFVATGPATAKTPPPVCKGNDILAAMKSDAPGDHRRIMAEAEATPNGQALFWRIERPGRPPSFLLGTIHVTDPRVLRLPDRIATAAAKAGTVVLEAIDLNEQRIGIAMASLGTEMFFTDGRSLANFLTPGESAKISTLLRERGLPADFASAVKPWFVSVFLALPMCEQLRAAAGLESLDQHLETMARKRGAKLIGLETIEEQFRAMAGIPLAAQVAWLKASLKLYDRTNDSLETMIRLYLGRRIGAIWPLTRVMIANERLAKAGIRDFQHALITVRNQRMRQRLGPILDKGGAFVGVGALHLGGAEGLVALLRQDGYRVVPAE